MKLEACRDCGALLAADARGCPQCARNVAAERVLARCVRLGALPALLLLLALVLLLAHNR
ncbi:MAG TPA: hypothetical protein VF525_06445 [Pyrinomonadaceae bacterium]|jgi:hypothetical protein